MKPWFVVIAGAALGFAIHAIANPGRDPVPSDAARALAPTPGPREGTRAPAWRPAPAPPGGLAEIARAVRVSPEGTDGAGAGSAGPAPSPQEVRDRFEAFFGAENVDPAWNRGAADAVARGIEALLPVGSRLNRVECRGTICRIETGHPDADAFRAYAQSAFLDRETRVGSSGVFASVLAPPSPGGSVVAVAYLAREGKELPGPEALFATADH